MSAVFCADPSACNRDSLSECRVVRLPINQAVDQSATQSTSQSENQSANQTANSSANSSAMLLECHAILLECPSAIG